MTVIHLEVEVAQDALQRLRQALRACEGELTGLQQHYLRLEHTWQGPAAEMFFAQFRQWLTHSRPLLERLETLVRAGEREVQEWLTVDRRGLASASAVHSPGASRGSLYPSPQAQTPVPEADESPDSPAATLPTPSAASSQASTRSDQARVAASVANASDVPTDVHANTRGAEASPRAGQAIDSFRLEGRAPETEGTPGTDPSTSPSPPTSEAGAPAPEMAARGPSDVSAVPASASGPGSPEGGGSSPDSGPRGASVQGSGGGTTSDGGGGSGAYASHAASRMEPAARAGATPPHDARVPRRMATTAASPLEGAGATTSAMDAEDAFTAARWWLVGLGGAALAGGVGYGIYAARKRGAAADDVVSGDTLAPDASPAAPSQMANEALHYDPEAQQIGLGWIGEDAPMEEPLSEPWADLTIPLPETRSELSDGAGEDDPLGSATIPTRGWPGNNEESA